MTVQRRVGLVLSLWIMLTLSGGVPARETCASAATIPETWRMEAEAGALTAPMAVGQNTGASACGYVAAPGATGAAT